MQQLPFAGIILFKSDMMNNYWLYGFDAINANRLEFLFNC